MEHGENGGPRLRGVPLQLILLIAHLCSTPDGLDSGHRPFKSQVSKILSFEQIYTNCSEHLCLPGTVLCIHIYGSRRLNRAVVDRFHSMIFIYQSLIVLSTNYVFQTRLSKG